MFERFTVQARATVHGANDSSRELGHNYIGTEHLLLALLAPEAGIPHTVLSDAGLTVEQVKADIEACLSGSGVLSLGDKAALEAIGIDLDAVRAKIEESFGPGALAPPPPPCRRRGVFRRRRSGAGRPTVGQYRPFTVRSKKVLELSLREALRLHHNYIGTEHMLLGLIREGDGLAAKIICDAGIDLDDLRRRTLSSIPNPAA
jgi:ATP-dependent Clp protease ATP-binding subunit ClpA